MKRSIWTDLTVLAVFVIVIIALAPSSNITGQATGSNGSGGDFFSGFVDFFTNLFRSIGLTDDEISQKIETLLAENAEYFKIPEDASAENIYIGMKYTQDDKYKLNEKNVISLAINGSLLLNSEDSFARVLAVDNKGNEYLVFESNFLEDGKDVYFENYCEETCIIDPSRIKELRVHVEDAYLSINYISIQRYDSKLMKKVLSKLIYKLRQDEVKIDKITAKNLRKNLKWDADKTSLSKLSYAEKKKLFLKNGKPVDKLPNLKGMEYYSGGEFERPISDDITIDTSVICPVENDGNCDGVPDTGHGAGAAWFHPFVVEGEVSDLPEKGSVIEDAIAIITGNVAGAAPANGLIAHYEFENNLLDSSGNNRHGTISNDVTYATGKIGQAAKFDGNGDRVKLPTNNPVWLPSGDFSLATWVYFYDAPEVTDYILDMNHGDSSYPLNELGYSLRRSSTGYAQFLMTTSDTDEDLTSPTKLMSGKWYHLVAVRDGTSQKLYVDGVLDASRTCKSTPIDWVGGYDNNEVSIGGFTRAGSSNFKFWVNGLIDDVRIYNTALSLSEVQGIYTGESSTTSTTILTTSTTIDPVDDLVIDEPGLGSIDFTGESIAVSEADIEAYVTITDNSISVDSVNLPELDKPARLTLYNLPFSETPDILKDGVPCSDCTVVSYTGGTFVFDVTGFTTYTATVSPTASSSTTTTSSILPTDFNLIDTVPGYIWHRGCGPTAVGMIVGYWDQFNKYNNLVPGDAYTQTGAVYDMIASVEHVSDYSNPIDNTGTGIRADKSETGESHSDNSVADYMETSFSSENNYYGWSWYSDIDNAIEDYFTKKAGYTKSDAKNRVWGSFNWDLYKAEIDAGRPVGLIVDTNADGWTDHFITGIGYKIDNGVKKYGALNTWTADVRWYNFQQMGSGRSWGIYGATTFDPDTTADEF